jgi:hypothetical protein
MDSGLCLQGLSILILASIQLLIRLILQVCVTDIAYLYRIGDITSGDHLLDVRGAGPVIHALTASAHGLDTPCGADGTVFEP